MNADSYTRRDFLKAAGLATAALMVPGCTSAFQSLGGKDKRPNIILIMADDMGYSDIGCYGGEIHTPSLDRLAAGGLRFTQFYNTARCCPTRASLMTGLYQHQAGVGHMMNGRGYDSYRGDLSNRCVTIAEVLKQAGYSTYMLVSGMSLGTESRMIRNITGLASADSTASSEPFTVQAVSTTHAR